MGDWVHDTLRKGARDLLRAALDLGHPRLLQQQGL